MPEVGCNDPLIVLDHADPSMTLVYEETFGPVSPVIAFDSLDHAIHIGNGTPFGGIKDSGFGYKEAVQEVMKSFTNLKTLSLLWGVIEWH